MNKITQYVAIILVSIMALPMFSLAVDSLPPAIPLFVYGDVTIDGVVAPISTEVVVFNGISEVASVITDTEGKYYFDVPASNAGATLSYKVNGIFVLDKVCVNPITSAKDKIDLPASSTVTVNTPTGLVASVQSTTQIDLSWDAVSGVDGYELYKNDSLLTTTSNTSYSDTGLSASIAYNYKIRSYISSLKSDFSAVVLATTEAEPAPDPPVNSGGGGGGGSTPPAPTTVNSSNTSLTVSSTQAGTVDYTFTDTSSAEIEIPIGAVSSNTTFSIAQGELTADQIPLETTGAFMVGDQIFNINAVDSNNNSVTSFNENLIITFTIPDLPEDTTDLAIYYFKESTNEWILVSGSEFNTTDKTATFDVNHLTKFAIFQITGTPASLITSTTTDEPVPVGTITGEVLGTKVAFDVTAYVEAEKEKLTTLNSNLTNQVLGKILLQVEDHGEAWYVDSLTKLRYYLADGPTAYEALRKFGLGITNADLAKIPVGIETRFEDVDADTDGDGLADQLEEGLGTDANKTDTDGDGVSDYEEVINNNTNPLGTGNLVYNASLANKLKGRILLQVESHGEAWYVNPTDGRRYYMKDGNVAYQIMRFLSLGITNENIYKIGIGDL